MHYSPICVLVTLFYLLYHCTSGSPLFYPPTCFFSIQKDSNGIFWFVDPLGNTSVARGVNGVGIVGDYSPSQGVYPYNSAVLAEFPTNTTPKWTEQAYERLTRWGYTTMGPFGDSSSTLYPLFPRFELLQLAIKSGAANYKVLDFFDPSVAAKMKSVAVSGVAYQATDSKVIGYWSDNELNWGLGWQGGRSILSHYMSFPVSAPGYMTALNFLQSRYTTPAALSVAWGLLTPLTSFALFVSVPWTPTSQDTPKRQQDESDFLFIVASEYYRISRDAIKSQSSYGLFLCDRVGGIPRSVRMTGLFQAAALYCDALSFNYYQNPSMLEVNWAHNLTGLPLLISEFSWRGADIGLPYGNGGVIVPTQTDRANRFGQYVMNITRHPAVIGYIWFQYIDDIDVDVGENGNYGCVNTTNQEYTLLTTSMRTHNALVDSNHRVGATNPVLPPLCLSTRPCPGNCSGHGCCNTETGKCKCASGWTSASCATNNTVLSLDFTNNVDPPPNTFKLTNDVWGLATFASKNTIVTGGALRIAINNAGCPADCGGKLYSAGGLSTNVNYGYGTATVRAKVFVLPNAMFQIHTLTGAWEGGNPNDQIMWQFTGTDKFSFDIRGYANGVFFNVARVTLPYDVTAAYHDFKYIWSKMSMQFYVDNVLVGSISSPSSPIPSAPGKISVKASVLGSGFNSALPVYAYVQSINFVANDAITCDPPPPPVPTTTTGTPQVTTCPADCSNRGCCNRITNVCACANGWSGADCSVNRTVSLYDFTTNVDPTSSSFHVTGSWGISQLLAANAKVIGGAMRLEINNAGCPTGCGGKAYSAGGWSTNSNLGYGKLTYRVKALWKQNAILQLQTLTGSWEGGNPNDQIMWQFNGANSNTVNIRGYANNTYFSVASVVVPFDTTADFHDYTYEWSPASLLFYIDNVQVASRYASSSVKLPTAGGKLQPKVAAMAGFNAEVPMYAYIQYVRFEALQVLPRVCETEPYQPLATTTTSSGPDATTAAFFSATTSELDSATTAAYDSVTTSAYNSATTFGSHTSTTGAAHIATTSALQSTTTNALYSATTSVMNSATTSAAQSATTSAAQSATTSAAQSATTSANSFSTSTASAATTASASGSATTTALSTTTTGPAGAPPAVPFCLLHKQSFDLQQYRVVDVGTSGSNAMGQLQTYGSVPGRLWTFTSASEIRHTTLANVCLEVRTSITAGKRVGVWTCHGGNNQKWIMDAQGTIGFGLVRNRAVPTLCLDTVGDTTTAGTQLQLSVCNAQDPSQLWSVYIPVNATSRFNIVSMQAFNAGLHRVVDSGSTNGATAKLADRSNAAGRVFLNTVLGETRPASATSLCFESKGAVTVAGQLTGLWTCNNTSHQRWIITMFGVPGFGQIQNVADPSLCLDAKGSGIGVGTQLQIAVCNGQPNQAWAIYTA